MSETGTKERPPTFAGTSKVVGTKYPLIDNDPHFKRVVAYARTSDYIAGALTAAIGPSFIYTWEKFEPSGAGKGGFAKMMRLTGAVGVMAGCVMVYQRSSLRFYGMKENAREIEMDMREMVDRVKAGKPLYGESTLSPYLQGVASRQGRYSALLLGVIPWFNFVNHNQHGVDTAKYYQQAERELEAERTGK